MFSLLTTLLLSCITLIIVYLYNHYTYWQKRGVCCETPLPLFGNFFGVGRTLQLKDVNRRLYNKFKSQAPFCGYYMFLTKAVLIFDLDLIKNILIKDFANFHDRAIFNNIEDDPLTGHLVNLEGEQWKAMRNKLTPVFTSARMKYMFSTVVEVGENFAKALQKAAVESPDSVVEIRDFCARFTTDVIGTCAFGIECNSLQDPNAEFRQKGRSIFTETRHIPIVQFFLITNPQLARKLHFKLLTDQVTEFFLNIVRQTVNYRLENNIKRNDFMDLIIELKAKNDEENHIKAAKGIDLSYGLTIEQMAAQTFVFFVAGFETSSTTMSFCLYELSQNPDIQEKLRREILDIIQQAKGELTYEAMNSMKYLEQVIAETLRMYPVVPHLIRKTKNNYRVPNTSYTIENGITVTIPVESIHYDPNLYPNPNQFDPSRFQPQEIEKRHPCAYLPFGDGPRNCIGSRFAKMQMKIGLISLLQRYRFESCSKTEIPLQFDKKNFIVAPKDGIHLQIIPLERN